MGAGLRPWRSIRIPGSNGGSQANFVYETGSFYNGDRQSIALNTGRVQVTPQVSLEPSFSINWVDLVQGAFTAKVRAPARLTRLDDFKPRNCVPTCRHCATAPS